MARFACAGCGAVAEQDSACAACGSRNRIIELVLDDTAAAERSESRTAMLGGRDRSALRTLSTVRETLAAHRQARGACRRLKRELAEYRTPAERLELKTILARYPSEQTWEIRRVLAWQEDAARLRCGTSPRPDDRDPI